MKHIIILFLFYLFPVMVNAQAKIEIGMGIADNDTPELDAGSRLGLKLGIGYEYHLSPILGIEPAVVLENKGKRHFRMTYLDIPITVNFHFNMAEVDFGPYLGYRIDSSERDVRDKVIFDGVPSDHSYRLLSTADELFSEFDFGFVARVKRHCGKHVYIGAEGSYGVLNIGRDFGTKYLLTREKYNGHNYTAGLLLGLTF